MPSMTIGELATRTGLAVRTLRFYADAGILPVAGRSDGGYRLFGAEAVPRARLVRTLRELGVGLDDVRRVLEAEATLQDVAAAHARALGAQIRLLELQRSVLAAVATTTDPEELERMTELTTMTDDARERLVEDYLEAVFGEDQGHAVAEKFRVGIPELPAEPTPAQVTAWVELAELLRDPDFRARSREMAERARRDGPEPDPAAEHVGPAVVEHAGAAVREGLDPASPAALAVVERLEALSPTREDRRAAAERIEAFTDRRIARYWTLVGVVNDWPAEQRAQPDAMIDAWQWYARALLAHAG